MTVAPRLPAARGRLPAIVAGLAAATAGAGCHRQAGPAAAPDAGPPSEAPLDVLCVEQAEGCVICEGRGPLPPLADPEEPRHTECDPKDAERCVEFCSRLAPDCALPWHPGGATCLSRSDAEFRRARFWRDAAGRPDSTFLGRAVDEAGKRVESARVRVFAGAVLIAEETTGKDGSFRTRLPVTGRGYVVQVTHPGRATEILEVRPAVDKGDKPPPASRLFHLGPESTIKGRVVDGDGAAVAGVHMVAVRSAEELVESGDAVTAEDGTFTLGGLEGRRYTLRASKFGWLGATLKTPVTAPATKVTVKLQATGVIRGRVVDRDAQPEANATVVALPSGPSSSSQSSISWHALGDGRFAQDRFEPGTYYLWARRGETLVYPPAKVELGLGDDLTMEADVTLKLDRRGGRVTGQVQPIEGSVLASGTRVKLHPLSPLALPLDVWADVDRAGHFAGGPLLPGRYEVSVHAGTKTLTHVRGPRDVELPIDEASVAPLPEPIVVRPRTDD